MIPFEFATAARIVFGAGAVSRVLEIAKELGGSRALVVTGNDRARSAALIAALNAAGFECRSFTVSGEPTLDCVRQGATEARGCDVVIAIGGGSAIDGGKYAPSIVMRSSWRGNWRFDLCVGRSATR